LDQFQTQGLNGLHNDFERSVFKAYPLIEDLKNALYHAGASYAAMSGSGSSVYGIFEKEPDLNLNWLFKGEDPIFRNNATPCMDLQMVSEPTSHYIVEPGSTFISFINLFAFLMSSGPGVDQPKTIYQGEASHIIEWEPLTRYLMVSNLQINNNRLGIFVSNLGIHLAYQASTDATTTIIITEKGQEVLLNTPLITSKWLVLGQLHQSTNGQLPDAEILAKINAAKKI
jgi:hypothetical protein